jgi:hypothetical protein
MIVSFPAGIGIDGTFYRRACDAVGTARQIKRGGKTFLRKFQIAPCVRGGKA